jgi:hypothetical protein
VGERPFFTASVGDRDLTAVQEGREIYGRYSLADLNLLARTLGIEPWDLTVAGVVRTTALPREQGHG